jgi:hypothetical protein
MPSGPPLLTSDGISPVTSFDAVSLSGRVEVIDMYELAARDFAVHRALLLNGSCDQMELQRLQGRLFAYLLAGGVIVFCGHVAHPFLPMLQRFVPMASRKPRDLEVRLDGSHAIYSGVADRDVTFRRGVAGFFGRGANPPPEQARITARIDEGRVPVDWELPVGAGILYVHAAIDFWSLVAPEDGTAARIPANLLGWIDAHHVRRAV